MRPLQSLLGLQLCHCIITWLLSSRPKNKERKKIPQRSLSSSLSWHSTPACCTHMKSSCLWHFPNNLKTHWISKYFCGWLTSCEGLWWVRNREAEVEGLASEDLAQSCSPCDYLLFLLVGRSIWVTTASNTHPRLHRLGCAFSKTQSNLEISIDCAWWPRKDPSICPPIWLKPNALMQVRAPLSILVNNQKVVLMGCEDLREYTTTIVDGG